MRDEAFAAAAEGALGPVPTELCQLGSGQQIVPRDFLRVLAATAGDWPHTPSEIWYGEIMQDCFWALTRRHPAPSYGEDERTAAEGLALGVLLAMMSMDRGGHHAAADLCQPALAYMAILPAWRGVQIESDASADQITLILDAAANDSPGTQGEPDDPNTAS